MTFAIDSGNFFQVSLQKILIRKDKSMYAPFTIIFNTSILKSSHGNKANLLFQTDNIKEDLLAPSIRKQEKIEASVLEADLKIEESEREIWTDLKLQYARDIVKLQEAYSVQYKENHNFISLQIFALVLEDKSVLGKTYISKKPISRILMIC